MSLKTKLKIFTELSEAQKKRIQEDGLRQWFAVTDEDQENIFESVHLTDCISFAKKQDQYVYISTFVGGY